MNPFGQQPFFYYPMNERYMGVPGMAYPGRQPMQPLPAQPRALQGWQMPQQGGGYMPPQGYGFRGQPAGNRTIPKQLPPKTTAPVSPNAAASQVKKSARPKLAPECFTAHDLSQADLDTIISKFGTEIDDIYPLSAGQNWMFGKAQRVTNAFFIQELIKITLKLKPSTFRQRVDEMSLKRSNLRTAFSYRGQEKPYQVVLKNRRPGLRFVDRSDKTLSELEEELIQFRAADRRRGFDLERDPLLRITVFSTADEDTYALVVSQPHINHDGASEMMFYKELLMDYVMDGKADMPDMSAGSYQDYANYLQGIDKDAELGYWESLLKGSAATRLPGRLQSSLEPSISNLELCFEGAKVAALPARYRATMNSIMQSAWGIMLQKLYGTKDAVFGTITSGRTSEVANNSTMTGSFVNAFPVRITASGEETFSQVVERTQRQMIESLQKAHCSPDEIRQRLGSEEAVFDHLLNFQNFMDATKDAPILPGITFLGMDCFDNLSTGCCVYLRQEKDAFSCNFSYDCRSFPERKIRILSECFRQIMDGLLDDEDGKLTVDELKCPDISVFISSGKDEEEERTRLVGSLRGNSLFDGVDDAAIYELSEMVETVSYMEGDTIFLERKPLSGLHIVLSGHVQLSRSTLDGWENPLVIRKSGQILSASGVLHHGESHTSATVVQGQTRITRIPADDLRHFIERYPVIGLNIVSQQEDLIRALSFLWVNAG